MNTSSKDSTALNSLSFIAIVSCLVSVAYFLCTNVLA